MQTPVALIIFKRPYTTERVFEAIRQAKPPKLFVIADGPRADHSDEAQKCEATRAIIERVDWDCEVVKNYSDTNLGCAKRISGGLDWVFSNVEEAIILEDDCLPNPAFFPFCEELLEQYRYDSRIASISGSNFQFGHKRTNYSYYYSIFNHCWGWASWRRAWQYFDVYMKLWPEIQAGGVLNDILKDSRAVRYWSNIFQSAYENPSDKIWDYQWTFACWIQSGLCIIPNVNLISNIGLGSDSTHFNSSKECAFINMSTEAIELPLKHPPFIVTNLKADSFTQKTVFKESMLQRLKQRLKKIIKA